ncbi:hypothetical protein DB346_15480 [Verrucomicrobia bacterium LW23]|nr:hypothetical protein DB346_15480 [Verrucomicrobia bacterium LW23]
MTHHPTTFRPRFAPAGALATPCRLADWLRHGTAVVPGAPVRAVRGVAKVLVAVLFATAMAMAFAASPATLRADSPAAAPASSPAGQIPADAMLMLDFENLRKLCWGMTVDAAGPEMPAAEWSEKAAEARRLVEVLAGHVRSPEGSALVKGLFDSLSPSVGAAPSFADNRKAAEWAGVARARLEHIAAAEMLAAQKRGDVAATQMWRAMILLPKHANLIEGAMAIQRLIASGSAQDGVTQLLAREAITCQSSRIREKLEAARRLILSGHPTLPLLAGRVAEIDTLADTPGWLVAAANVPAAAAGAKPSGNGSYEQLAEAWLARFKAAPGAEAESNSGQVITAANSDKPVPAPGASAEKITLPEGFVQWRESIELGLPNLLTDNEINRRQRLMLKLLRLIPKEFDAGVREGRIVVPIEYREAVVFTSNVDEIINELAPAWRTSKAEIHAKNAPLLEKEMDALEEAITSKAPSADVHRHANAALGILEGPYELTLFRAGARTDVISEMLLEVRSSLMDSLKAARAGRWQEAESLRLDAYSTFDTEIEIRAMTRDAALAIRTEKSFLEGDPGKLGIKALLDRRAPIAEIEAAYQRTLGLLDECGALLKVVISPAAVVFQAFTIVAREGLEAVVILAALLAGMRGAAYARQRKLIAVGSLLAVVASVLIFWLSQTLIASLMKYGEHLEAVISIAAVGILLMVTNWVFHKYYWVGWNSTLRELAGAVNKKTDTLWDSIAMMGVGFLTIFREGFETTLFMQSLMFDGGTDSVALGFGIGVVSILVLGWLIFVLGNKLPYRKMLVVTGFLVVSILMTFTGSTVRILQTIGWLPIHPIEGLTIPNWMGLWLGLYPSWEGIIIPLLSLVYVAGAWLYVKFTASRGPQPEQGPQMVTAESVAQERAEANAEKPAEAVPN